MMADRAIVNGYCCKTMSSPGRKAFEMGCWCVCCVGTTVVGWSGVDGEKKFELVACTDYTSVGKYLSTYVGNHLCKQQSMQKEPWTRTLLFVIP